MLKHFFSTVVIGMLQYYGVLPITDLLMLCTRYGLCRLTDYKALLSQIHTVLAPSQQVYCYHKLICHKKNRNPVLLRELQKKTVAGGYKGFSLEEYWLAGTTQGVWCTEMETLKQFLLQEKRTFITVQQIENEIIRLWTEINNRGDFILLTSQCVENMMLPWQRSTPEYMQLMERICTMADTMPNWACKGYSPMEVRCQEKVLLDRRE